MYYTERKPKNENGGGLGTRLPFVNIKAAKFLFFMCKVSKLLFNPAYFKLFSRPKSNINLSAIVPLMVIAQAIQQNWGAT